MLLTFTMAAAGAGLIGRRPLPMAFEKNSGEKDPRVLYFSRGGSVSVLISDSGLALALPPSRITGAGRTSGLLVSLAGAGPCRSVTARAEMKASANYFIGRDATKWRTNVPLYEEVICEAAFPGVDIVYRGSGGLLETEFLVHRGADPGALQFRVDGAESAAADADGNIEYRIGGHEIRFRAASPGKQANSPRARFARYATNGPSLLSLELQPRDAVPNLTPAPQIGYSTLIGGLGLDAGNSITVDAGRNTYIAGFTYSADFRTSPDSVEPIFSGAIDAFVTKLDKTGALVYSTYFGGTGQDTANAVALDAAGDVFIAGQTSSVDFPLWGAYQISPGGIFAAKLNNQGNALVYSTYLGTNLNDRANGIAVDGSGSAYITGAVFAPDLVTTTGAFQQSFAGGIKDAFALKLNPAGTALLYATYLGGTGQDEGAAIAIDAAGAAYVAGTTYSSNFPTTASAYQRALGGVRDAFVTKLDAAGRSLLYSTVLGGSGTENGAGITLDSSGSVYVTGQTTSSDFPVSAGAIRSTLGGPSDAYVARLNPSGSTLLYATYLGGAGNDAGAALALDRSGLVSVAGHTESTDFPVAIGAIQTALNGTLGDAFLATLDLSAPEPVFSTYLGGSQAEEARALAINAWGDIVLTGYTSSADLPTTPGALQQSAGGGWDGFVVLMVKPHVLGVPYDYSGDGRGDVLLYVPDRGAQYSAVSSGYGIYSYTGHTWSRGYDTIRSGDWNGDGRTDVVVYNSATGLAYAGLSDGTGNFTFSGLSWGPNYDTAETGDLDGDGTTDLVLYNKTTGSTYTALSDGIGHFTTVYQLWSPGFTHVRTGDWDGDGKTDVVLYNSATGNCYVGISTGDGNFRFTGTSWGPGYSAIETGDFNHDGKTDLLLYNSKTGTSYTAISDGTGRFSYRYHCWSAGYTHVLAVDWNGDGRTDVVVYNSRTGAAYRGSGDGLGNFAFSGMFWSPSYDFIAPRDLAGNGATGFVLYNSATGTCYTVTSSGGNFSYQYNYWGTGRIITR
jgi:hypothetical protein